MHPLVLTAAVLTVLQFVLVPLLGRTPTATAASGPGSITLRVQSARTVAPPPAVQKGAPVASYEWLIAVDDVGNPNDALANCLPARAGVNSKPNYADTCQWPSVRYTPGAVKVVTQGNQADLNATKALGKLPPGKYLISVTAAGYKIDGAHFTVTSGQTTPVTVDMQPYPLPLGTVRLNVFHDNVPVDGTYEAGAEQGLAGFTAHLSDVLGPVTTDYYGNPLCTTYLHTPADATHPAGQIQFADGKPVIDPTSTGKCVSDAVGQVVIPNLGPNRYAATVVPPTGQTWYQTTTLEGNHDWDIWVQEGDTGYDTEQTIGGEKVPAVHFGFVEPKALPIGYTGEVKGVVVRGLSYIGGKGGVTVPETGTAGAKVQGPIANPIVSLSDMSNGDAMVYTGRGDAQGRFDIKGVPPGTYQLTLWDYAQETILWSFNVTVGDGQVVDVGTKMLVGWFTTVTGTIFVDTNGNGKRDPGEPGVPRFTVAVKERDNSLMDQGVNTVTTDDAGNYTINEVYPLSKWLVLEAFNTRYHTTGVTYQADNQPTPTTLTGAAVDISILPIIGLGGRVDWGVQPYAGAENGGIAGTVTYDTTRNELDPAAAATETYQPGIPGIKMRLFAVARDPKTGQPLTNPDGSVQRGPQLADAYTSETWEQPRGCMARQYNGTQLTDQLALPDFSKKALCVEAPMMGFQAQPSDTTKGNFGQTVNGNYAFSTSTRNLYPPGNPNNPAPGHDLPLYANLEEAGYPDQSLAPGQYVVAADIPKDKYGKPLYQVTKEEDVNIFRGDGFLPQDNFPPSVAQAAAPPPGQQALPKPPSPISEQAGIIPECAGALHTVTVTDPAFLAGGGSPYEGQRRPLCDSKVVDVRAGQTTAPNFNLFTEVPLPTHFWGLVINDLALAVDKRSASYGEAAGIPNVPVGLYDWAGKLATSVTTDFNGFYEALVPSTSTYNCPLPAGPCPNVYRFVGNDPGQPGAFNANYNPRFRTIATNFQAWPGLYTVTDTAPTQVANVALVPGAAQATPVNCNVAATAPQLFAVDRPYLRSDDTNRSVTITGRGFGASQGNGQVTLDPGLSGTGAALPVASWSDTQITVSIDATTHLGPAQLRIVNAAGQATTNGITVQLLGSAAGSGTADNPQLLQVDPARTHTAAGAASIYDTVQAALDAAAATAGAKVVVVWPGRMEQNNPRGAYFENVIVHSAVRLQGVGPGGVAADGSYVPGSVLDGLGFNPDNDLGAAWYALLGQLRYAGPAQVPDAAVVTVLGAPNASGPAGAIDGFTITGGKQSDWATNVNTTFGGTKTPLGAPGAAVTQGGGVYVHAGVRGLSVTDNVVVGNGGAYGGGIRVGTPYAGNLGNDNLRIAYNQIRDNGGTNLAGAVGLFAGTNGYRIDHNDLCGNHSAEYGGAISHFGQSTGGDIGNNRIWFNQSYDEGGGILVAGELPADPTQPSTGSGPVKIHENLVQSNLANDDGGGIRLLQAGVWPVDIVNNIIVNNISAHEGGGLALDDSVNVRIVNNTVMKNITTATAVTSDGRPAPAGLSVVANSQQLTATMNDPALFSPPLLFNNIFWDNRAGSWTGSYVAGIGSPDAPAGDPVKHWDMGAADGSGALAPTHSVLQTTAGTVTDASNVVGTDPGVLATFDTSVSIQASRLFPAFRQAVIVAQNVPPSLMGNYHLAGAGSPASNAGAPSKTYGLEPVPAPRIDYDGQVRSLTQPDIGADEIPPVP